MIKLHDAMLRRCRAVMRQLNIFCPGFFKSINWLWSVIALYIITFVIVLPWLCNDWAYSIYLSDSMTSEKLTELVHLKNQQQLSLANEYIAGLDPDASLRSYESILGVHDVDIAVAVITVQRRFGKHDLGYLTQLMARMDQLFKEDKSFSKKALFICNVHAGPSQHDEASRLGMYFSVSSRFPDGDTASVILDHFEKEKQDYVYCMEEAMNYRPKYIMLVEDDALPRYDMLAVVKNALDHKVGYKMRTDALGADRQNWAYLKLYYPRKWQGYASELRPMLELMAFGAVGGSLVVAASKLCDTRRFYRHRNRMRGHFVVFCSGALYVMTLAVVVGRPYVLELRRICSALYTVVQAPECCTQGILYPSHVVPQIVAELHNTRCTSSKPVDLAINNFVTARHYQTYIIEPNLFKHIGYISTIKGPSPDPAMFIY